jgi:hypothetical protein
LLGSKRIGFFNGLDEGQFAACWLVGLMLLLLAILEVRRAALESARAAE